MAAVPRLAPEALAGGRARPRHHGTLDVARALVALPRNVWLHPDTGHSILAGLGRFCPWVRHGDTCAAIGKTDDILTVEFHEAVFLPPQQEISNVGAFSEVRQAPNAPSHGARPYNLFGVR